MHQLEGCMHIDEQKDLGYREHLTNKRTKSETFVIDGKDISTNLWLSASLVPMQCCTSVLTWPSDVCKRASLPSRGTPIKVIPRPARPADPTDIISCLSILKHCESEESHQLTWLFGQQRTADEQCTCLHHQLTDAVTF